MKKEYKPLSDDDLKDMHGKLREQFDYASKMLRKWKDAGFFNDENTHDPEKMVRGYNEAAPIVTTMATTAEALVTLEREIEERSDKKSRVSLPKP